MVNSSKGKCTCNFVMSVSTNGFDDLVLEDLMKMCEAIALKYVEAMIKLMKV